MDKQHQNIIDLCRVQGTSLASVCFKIRHKAIDGSDLNLECREFIAKIMINRIQEKYEAWKLRTNTTVAACTVIPYFDIDFYGLANICKTLSELDTFTTFAAELRKSDLMPSDKIGFSDDQSLKDRLNIPLNLPRKFLRKSSLRASFDSGVECLQLTQTTSTPAQQRWSLTPSGSSDLDDSEIMDGQTRFGRSLTTGSNLKLKVKAGAKISIASVSLMFRLGRDLKPRDKFRSLSLFDHHIVSIQQLFGVQRSVSSVMEINNQSLSRLGYYFNLSEIQQDSMQRTQIEPVKNMLNPKQGLAEDSTTAVVSYFEKIPTRNLFPESLFVTEDILELLKKFIPEYITNIGMQLLYSKVRDGTSYQR
jgi:hypothetical protein